MSQVSIRVATREVLLIQLNCISYTCSDLNKNVAIRYVTIKEIVKTVCINFLFEVQL